MNSQTGTYQSWLQKVLMQNVILNSNKTFVTNNIYKFILYFLFYLKVIYIIRQKIRILIIKTLFYQNNAISGTNTACF